jgi:hypothetical protein
MTSHSTNRTIVRHDRGITFSFDSVDPASEPLAECRSHQAVRKGRKILVDHPRLDYGDAVTRLEEN